MDKNAITAIRTSEWTREQWLKERKTSIGGSEIAAVAGLSRYKGPLQIYWDKVNPNVEPQEDNESMYWGRTLEGILMAEFQKRTGLKTVACPFLLKSKAYPFMSANLDGIATNEATGEKMVLEIKTANGFAAKDWENGMPPEYYLQVQWYLSITQLSKAYIAVLIGGQKFRYEEVARDEETIQTLITLSSKFWNDHVLKKIPPQPDATSGAVLDSLYPSSNQTSVILPPSADQLVATIRECKSVEEDLKKTALEAENRLKSMLKDSESGRTAKGFCVHWKSVSSNRLDTTKLKAEHPELVEKYTKTTSSRRFSITEPKA